MVALSGLRKRPVSWDWKPLCGLQEGQRSEQLDLSPFTSWIRQHGSAEHRAMISEWPLPRPRKWLQYVNEPETEAELVALRRSCMRGTPYGGTAWIEKTARKLGLEATLRSPGRPKK